MKSYKSLMACIVVLVFAVALNAAIPVAEREALIAFYNATGGDSWANNSGWKTPPLHTDGFALPGTEGSWYGIIGASDHVYYFSMNSNNLIGTIPAELGNLTNLQSLYLQANQLSGSIPSSLGNLTNLEWLYLGFNRLSGSIPSSLGNLTKVWYLQLTSNQLSGSIPSSLGNMTNLQYLDIYSNQLSGSIPSSLGNLLNLVWLNLDSNQLSGSIPSSLGNLAALEVLLLPSNQLTGEIPVALGNLTNLQYLHLRSNQLSGSIPSSLGKLANLQSLDLRSNQLSGSIPSSLGNLTNLFSINIRYNALYTDDSDLIAFLNNKDPNWWETQTIAPANVAATPVDLTTIKLTWNAIPYTANTGGYRIQVGVASGGPYVFYQQTADKTVTSHLVTGLDPGSTYWFVISTRTDPHDYNQNTVDSGYSGEAFAQTFSGAGIGLSRTHLCYGAAVGGQATRAQEVVISNVGTGAMNWTAVPTQTWLASEPESGTGNGVVSVLVNPAGLSEGTYNGQVTVAAEGAFNSPQSINVTLMVFSSGGTAPPFGVMDTPSEGAQVSGAIPVTGWALDDIEVVRVEIKRSPHGLDPPEAIGLDGLVYVGDGLFIEGARPDVEAAYPGYPLNYRAGWGFMVLTYGLPNQGNGTFTLHALGYDREGNRGSLGQKTIYGDNAKSILPFGTIDTPTQGGTASGTGYVNFGWALTPPPNMIPLDGSTLRVWVDGVGLGQPVYNNYRSDIATQYPGYLNSNGAVGYYYLDTTAYTNGLHTIAWGVADNAGNATGIGSRFFTVLNMGGDAAAGQTLQDKAEYGSSGRRGTVEEVLTVPVRLGRLTVRRGYEEGAGGEAVSADAGGVFRVSIREVERVEMELEGEQRGAGSSYAGYLVVGQELRPLPIGSALDPQTGLFTWQLGPGFLGTYQLAFVRTEPSGLKERTTVAIEITPKF